MGTLKQRWMERLRRMRQEPAEWDDGRGHQPAAPEPDDGEPTTMTDVIDMGAPATGLDKAATPDEPSSFVNAVMDPVATDTEPEAVTTGMDGEDSHAEHPTPRYAVLFMAYFWDDFVERRYQALCRNVHDGDVYIFLDVTNGDPGPVPHPRVLRVHEDMLVGMGLARVGIRSVIWHNGDYPLYYLFRYARPYDYYVRLEYDAVLNADVDALVTKVSRGGIDFLAEPINQGATSWHWADSCADHYPGHELRPHFIAASIYSSAAVGHLFEARRRHTLAFDPERPTAWPLSEGFVGSEMARSGLRIGAFSDHGATNYFTAWPPHLERTIDEVEDAIVLHPVLDGERFAASLVEGHPSLGDIILEDDDTLEKLRDFPLASYAPRLLRRLADFGREDVVGQLQPILFPRPDQWPEVSRNKPATQSSVSAWSTGQDVTADAARAVNGRITGHYAFHTDFEDEPWWMVDLQTQYELREIRIYNRVEQHERAAGAIVQVSRDGRLWQHVHRQDDASEWGGADGKPLVVVLSSIRARYVRVILPRFGCLHFDQVQVFGTHVG